MAAPDRPATIVVADDDDLVRAVLRMALSRPDTIVREAADSRGLVQALSDGAVDLVVLDISIPGQGLAANLAAVHELQPDSRVLILSGDSELPESESALVDDFARKPIELDDLRERVARLLDASSPRTSS